MKASSMWVFIVFCLVTLSGGCGGGGNPPADDNDPGATNDGTNDPGATNDGTNDPGPINHGVSWLAEGNFWLISWSEADVNRTWTDVFGDYDAGSYSMKLGPAVDDGDYVMHEISLTGDTQKMTPRWNYIGADRNGDIYAKVAVSDTPQLLYSAVRNEAGGGFFTDFSLSGLSVSTNTQMVPSNFTGPAKYFDGLTRVGYSGSDQDYDPGGCEYFAGYGTICTESSSGPSTGTTHYEYWDAAAGPVGNHFYDYYEDCLGTFCNSRKTERRTLVWSFGDAAGTKIAYHEEPDSYATPTPLPTDASFFNMIGEIHGSDQPSGYLAGYDAAVGMDLAATVHDWYAFEVLPGEEIMDFIFFLMWNDEANLEFYLYTAPDNPVYGFLYLAQSVTQTNPQGVNHAEAFSGTFLPGKYLLGVKRTVDAQYATGYGVMVIRGEDLDGTNNPVDTP